MKSKKEFWERYFLVYDRLNELIPYQELLGNIVAQLDIHKEEVIFEAGSGTGNLAFKIIEKDGQVIGMDNSKAGISIHKSKIPDAVIIFGDLAEKLPFANDYFNKICSNNVIYTLPKDKRRIVFSELYRVLKPGGMIVIANLLEGFKPYKIYLDHLKKSLKIYGLYPTIKKGIGLLIPTVKIFYYNHEIKKEHNSGHYNFMSYDEQQNLLRETGFINISKNNLVYSNQGMLNKAYK